MASDEHLRRCLVRGGWLYAFAAISAVVLSPIAQALEPIPDEKKQLEQCEASVCSLLLSKKPTTGWTTCQIGKTWIKKDIKKGARQKSISWTSGDARCSLEVKLERAAVVKALSSPKYEMRMTRHYVNCVVENDSGVDKVHVALAPRLQFKNGRVKKVWVNVKEVDAPPLLSSLIWTTVNFEDGFGIFHKEILKAVNKFIYKDCQKRHGTKSASRTTP